MHSRASDFVRPKEDDDEKQTRGVLAFASHIAPYKCTILPLDQRIARCGQRWHEKYLEYVTTLRQDICKRGRGGLFSRWTWQLSRPAGKELASNGLSYTMDESGSTVGKRYSRNDELGACHWQTHCLRAMITLNG
eukprot:3595023-Amphidinium_carterae.1